MTQERVVVVGAGLAGLVVAARLSQAGRETLLVEAAPRPGGQIHTLREDGLVVELGAEGFVARSRAVPALCAWLGIEAALADQLTTDTYCVEAGALVPLPPGEAARRLGFQVPDEELGRGIRSLSRGMGELTEALVQRLGSARLRLGARANSIRSGAGGGLELELDGGVSEACAQLVLAAPARAAAELLRPLGLPVTRTLASAPVTSNVSVNLLYDRAQFASYPAGSGLLFPDSFASRGLRAASLVDHKFADRVPPGSALLRVFFRPSRQALGEWDDARFAEEASAALAEVLAVDGSPRRAWVSRWVDVLPTFPAEYRQELADADEALQALGVHVTGSAFHGAGVDAAVVSAERVAARLGG